MAREKSHICPKKVTVDSINDKLPKKIPPPETRYKSIDMVGGKAEAVDHSVEFLKKQEPPNVPTHNLMSLAILYILTKYLSCGSEEQTLTYHNSN